MRMVMFAACIVGAVVYVSYDAYSEDSCLNDTQCPCRDWAEVQKNLEFTANTLGPSNRGCVEIRMHGGETAYEAFKHCNSAFSAPGLIGGRNKDLYNNCARYVCNWFMAQKPPWSPAC
jgi:hypothetical protein